MLSVPLLSAPTFDSQSWKAMPFGKVVSMSPENGSGGLWFCAGSGTQLATALNGGLNAVHT